MPPPVSYFTVYYLLDSKKSNKRATSEAEAKEAGEQEAGEQEAGNQASNAATGTLFCLFSSSYNNI